MDDKTILAHMEDLVTEKRVLSERAHAPEDDDHDRLVSLHEQLEQSRDLLLQRRARRDAGEDPGLVQARTVDEV